MKALQKSKYFSIYKLDELSCGEDVDKYIVSTEHTRNICNDPLVLGVNYTSKLTSACVETLKVLSELKILELDETSTTVLHILRGGLNFGLREALFHALEFNTHSSAFISAQRVKNSENPTDWFISESSYNKVHLRPINDIVFGDVVATGTSLEYALKRLGENALKQNSAIRSLTFFTIGGPRSHALIESVSKEYKQHFPNYRGANVIYFEGCFKVADHSTNLRVQIDGTDLLRTQSILAPEFIESQYNNPAYPLERCTIYDAGSRSFDIPEYIEDVLKYWESILELSNNGATYHDLIRERFPELDLKKLGEHSLRKLSLEQIHRAKSIA